MTVVASLTTNKLATATGSPAFIPASHATASCSTSGDRSMSSNLLPPVADRRDEVPAAAAAPPHGRAFVLAGVHAELLNRPTRRARPRSLHNRVRRLVGDGKQRKQRVAAGRGRDAAGAAVAALVRH